MDPRLSVQYRGPNANLSPIDANFIQSKRYTNPVEPDSKVIEIKLPPEKPASPSTLGLPLEPLSIEAVLARRPLVPTWENSPPKPRKRASTSPLVPTIRSRKSQVFNKFDGTIFKRLPNEIFDCIVAQLQVLHSDRLSPGCATCYMRDLNSLALTSRAWSPAAQRRLYGHVRITGTDTPQQLKKMKLKLGSRLTLLRRTLRRNSQLASFVHSLEVLDAGLSARDPNNGIDPQTQGYLDLVASVIMACPNLERLLGLQLTYSHDFQRLFHALSTRRKLKEQVWVIGENATVTQRSYKQLPPGLLDETQVYEFLMYHREWTKLETLMIHSLNGFGILETGVFQEMFQLLPNLKNLAVSSFDADDFNDRTLLALPTLNSLRLENLIGVTDQGLARYAATPFAQKLGKFSLLDMGLTSLLAISKILASLPRLFRFTLTQSDGCPELPTELMIFQPILASPSLRYLHWDVASRDAEMMPSLPPWEAIHAGPKSANTNLALSILHGGFPSLVSLRAPRDIDPPGALQAICCPTKNGKILLPTDKYSLPLRSIALGSIGSTGPHDLPKDNSLRAARIRSQHVIESAAKRPTEFIKVVITDHSDFEDLNHDSASSMNSDDSAATRHVPLDDEKRMLEELKGLMKNGPIKVHEFSLPSFVGRVATSTIAPSRHPPIFNLLPDIPGFEANGGIVGWDEFLGRNGNGDTVAITKDVCTGNWNSAHKSGPSWWKHAERNRRVNLVEPKNFF
ncbi:MAG: hypothetical protein Q9227_001793 [Pyrenula ochraceoflavens]